MWDASYYPQQLGDYEPKMGSHMCSYAFKHVRLGFKIRIVYLNHKKIVELS